MTSRGHVTDEEYAELQRRHGGQYVVRRGPEVLLSAATYDDLSARLDDRSIDWDQVVIEYIDPPDRVCAY
jgi:hypothetical protein